MEIRKIEAFSTAGLEYKQVAAYARVSTENEDMEHSLEAQITYYNEYIAGYPGWVFAGIYADDGVSGTKNNRPEFMRMMEDARAGKIDVIITKSVTRFARNILTLLSAVRELKTLGVDVVFEKENIRSLSSDGELMLSLLAMYAEEEARSVSENVHWRIEKQFEEGRPTFFRIYGYKWEDGQLKVVPEEAEIVRLIYAMYLAGHGRIAILKRLNEMGVKPPIGKAWSPTSVFRILGNEKYTGDLLLQKTYTADFREKKQIENKGQWRQFLVEGAHEAIIDKETFKQVQMEREARSRQVKSNCRPAPSRIAPESLFAGMIVCSECKKRFLYKNQKVKSSGTYVPIYICKSYLELGSKYCKAKRIRESILTDKTREVLGLEPDTEITRETVTSKIDAIESEADNTLRFFLKDGTVKIVSWENQSRSKSWTPEMKETARARAMKLNQMRKEEANV